MRPGKVIGVMGLVFALSMSGVVLAESESEMSDKEYCEAEAEQAGMISSEDIQEYVLQCLEEIQRQSDYGMDPDLNGDSEYDDTGDQ